MTIAAFVANLLVAFLTTGAGIAIAFPLAWTFDDLIDRLAGQPAYHAWWWQQ